MTAAWKSIESAPRDQIVFLGVPGALPIVGFWVEREKAWCGASMRHDWTVGGYMGGRAIPSPQPTLWMPLPDPPAEGT